MTGKQYASAGRALAEMFIFLCILIAYCSSARDVSAAEVYTEQKSRYGKNPYFIELSQIESIDIDYPEDFMFAEVMYQTFLKNK